VYQSEQTRTILNGKDSVQCSRGKKRSAANPIEQAPAATGFLVCDFTQFFAASALIKLPQRFSNEHKVGNEKEEILRTLPS
jgi:hypothetical protein